MLTVCLNLELLVVSYCSFLNRRDPVPIWLGQHESAKENGRKKR